MADCHCFFRARTAMPSTPREQHPPSWPHSGPVRVLSIVVFAVATAVCPAQAHAAASDPHPPAKAGAASKPAAGHAQASSHKPAADHKSAPEHKPAAVHKAAEPGAVPEAAARPALPRAATAAELEALSERIHQRVAEVTRTHKAKAATATAHQPAPAAVPRVHVEWRPSVSWPHELTDASAATDAGARVTLTWNPPAP
jgi:hypothetical protein